MEVKKVYFVSGIDTDAGKTYATGHIAKMWKREGLKVITQKLIQTGGTGYSEDISTHRRIMGERFLPVDFDFTTCPIRFTYPASPHLAARLMDCEIDLSDADRSTEILSGQFDTVLIEGAGGLMVPIRTDYTMLDYAREREYPIILVTNPHLGSINHTLLSLEACIRHGLSVDILAFNDWPATDEIITQDTRQYLKGYLERHLPDCQFIDIPRYAPSYRRVYGKKLTPYKGSV